MKIKLFFVLVLVSFASVLAAQETKTGDIAPRGALGYGTINDLSDALNKLGGEKWPVEARGVWDAFALWDRDTRELKPVADEIQSMQAYLGAVEVVLVDVMVREPFMQLIVKVKLREGAPTEFSEASRKTLQEMFEEDAEVTPTLITHELFTVRLVNGSLIVTVGGSAQTHVEDYLSGDAEETLAGDKRFKKWLEGAKSDVNLWIDMKAMRRAIDRMGEDVDSDFLVALDAVEFNKWDYFSAGMDIPSVTDSGFVLDANLVLSAPLDKAAVWLKPSGGNGLAGALPEETLAFASFQLGGDNEGTYRGILEYFHWLEQQTEPARLKRRIRRAEVDISRWKADAADEKSSEEDREWAEARLKESEAELEELKAMLEAFKPREFEPNPDARTGKRTDAEEAKDELEQFCKMMLGVEPAKALKSIGKEGIVGVLGPDDPHPDDADDMFDSLGFFMVETDPSFAEWKQQLFDRLAGKVPEGADEDTRKELERFAKKFRFEDVPGGKLLRDKNPLRQGVWFFGNGFVGIAATRWTARRMLASSEGTRPLNFADIPHGNTTGSKFGFVRLGELITRLMSQNALRSEIGGYGSRPDLDFAKLIRGGLRISAATTESPSNVGFTVMTEGESQIGQLLSILRDTVVREHQERHDRNELYALQNAIERWESNQESALRNLSDEERKKAIAKITPQSLLDASLLELRDGLRSAFDPKLKARWDKALNDGQREIGGEADLAEMGFDWFGLPSDLANKDPVDEDYEYMGHSGFRQSWLVCATKSAFADGRYIGIIHSTDGRFEIRHLSQRVYDAIRNANKSGERLVRFEIDQGEVPDWKLARQFHRNGSWELDDIGRILDARKQNGAYPTLTFDGRSVGEKPREALAEAMGVDIEELYVGDEILRNIVVTSGPEGFTVRLYRKKHWVEINQDEEWKLSWEQK